MANPIMTSLPEYVEQRRLPLIKEAVLKAKSASLFNLQTDVKWKAALNLLNVTPVLQDGSACGWNDAGTATLSQRVITAPMIKINQSFCDKQFMKYWTGYQVKVAAGQKTLPFEEDFTNAIVDEVKAKIEKLIWQGDTTKSSDADLKWIDGILKLIEDGGSGVNKVNITAGTSAYDAIKQVYMAIPEKVLEKSVIFVGTDLFRQFMQEMVEKNYYHYSADGGYPTEEFVFPASNVKVIAVNGLNNTNKIVASPLDNLFYGCDMMNDEEKFDLRYSFDFQEFRLVIEFNCGVQFAFGDQIVEGVIAAE